MPGCGSSWGTAATTVSELLDGHVVLGRGVPGPDLPQRPCAEAPGRWSGGWFHDPAPRLPVPSPAVMKMIGTASRRAVNTVAAAHQLPIVKFGKLDRKAEAMLP